MEDGVDVVEDGFGGRSVAEAIGDVVEEGLGEVGAAGHSHGAACCQNPIFVCRDVFKQRFSLPII